MGDIPLVVGRDVGVRAEKSRGNTLSPNFLTSRRHLTGTSQQRGSIVSQWCNSHHNKAVEVTSMDLIPYYMHIFLSTIKFHQSGKQLPQEYPSAVFYAPAVPRERPAQLEVCLAIPANSCITMEIQFEKDFLRYTEYPFDPNRGFDLSGATISYLDPETGKGCIIVTPKLLLTIPTPDFTMPYNVITLTSTLIVLFYGTFFNLVYRRFYSGPQFVRRLKMKLQSFFRLRRTDTKQD